MRFDPYVAGEEWYRDVLSLARHLGRSSLSAEIRALVEIRVSQISGCAFCLRFHTDQAQSDGIPQAKLDVLAGWRDSLRFSERERAALDLAESMTRIGDGRRVDEKTWSAARQHFDDRDLAALLYVIALINVWNRINVAVDLPESHSLP